MDVWKYFFAIVVCSRCVFFQFPSSVIDWCAHLEKVSSDSSSYILLYLTHLDRMCPSDACIYNYCTNYDTATITQKYHIYHYRRCISYVIRIACQHIDLVASCCRIHIGKRSIRHPTPPILQSLAPLLHTYVKIEVLNTIPSRIPTWKIDRVIDAEA